MTQAPRQIQYQQTQAMLSNHHARRSDPRPSNSRVHETVQKFNRIGKANDNTSPPPPLPPHRPRVPIPNNRNMTFATQETPLSSLSSSGDSMAHDQLVPLSQNDLERRRVRYPSAGNYPRRRTNGPRPPRVHTGPMTNRLADQPNPRRVARRSPPPPPVPPKIRNIHRSQSASQE